jgi:glutaredoxin
MSKDVKPILYVKSGCPWCTEAISYFNSQGVELEIRDVSKHADFMNAMVAVSGQTKAPTFEFDEFTVADFSVDEFLAELNAFPEVRQKLGLCDDEN